MSTPKKVGPKSSQEKAEKQFDLHVELTKYLETDATGVLGSGDKPENRKIV